MPYRRKINGASQRSCHEKPKLVTKIIRPNSKQKDMRWKYADFLYSVKKTKEGYMWTIWGDDGKPMQTSLENDDKEDQYLETKTAARSDAIDAIQDHYT